MFLGHAPTGDWYRRTLSAIARAGGEAYHSGVCRTTAEPQAICAADGTAATAGSTVTMTRW